jgi:hypothetical protein
MSSEEGFVIRFCSDSTDLGIESRLWLVFNQYQIKAIEGVGGTILFEHRGLCEILEDFAAS